MQENLIWNFGVTNLNLTSRTLKWQKYKKKIATAKNVKNSTLSFGKTRRYMMQKFEASRKVFKLQKR